MSSSSSESFESPNSSPRSQITDEQVQALEAQLDLVRGQIDSLVQDSEPNVQFDEYFGQYLEIDQNVRQSLNSIEGEVVETLSQPVSPSRPLVPREGFSHARSRSVENLSSSCSATSQRSLAATSRTSWISDLPSYSSQVSLTETEKPKTRRSVRRGDSSPLSHYQQGLPRRTRKRQTETNNPANMSTDDLTGGVTAALTPRWTLFLVKEGSFKKNLTTELATMQVSLADEGTTVDEAEDMATDIEGFEQELKDLETTWNALITLEPIDNTAWTKVGDEIRISKKNINRIKKKVQKALGQSTGQANGGNALSNNDDTLTALRNVAQAPKVQFPTFNGEIVLYVGFKRVFKYTVTLIGGSQKLWASHLYGCLQGDALKYVGSQGDWFNKYNELWECLDDRYANRWVLANDTIRDFIARPQPESTPEAINDYFYSQIDSLKSILELNMTLEQVGVNIICQSLPEEIGRDLKQGLRSLHPNKKQHAFSVKEIVSVYNDVISINGANGSEPLISTLGLKAAVNPNPRGKGHNGYKGRGQQNNNIPPPVYSPHNNNYSRPQSSRGRGSQNNRGRGGVYTSGRHKNCQLCKENHFPWQCPQYPDPSKIRDRLKQLRLCVACTGRVHEDECPDHVKCTEPQHIGERHMRWTCGGLDHPGKQEPHQS